MRVRSAFLTAVAILAFVVPAIAQEPTRADELRAQREAKAQHLEPYEPGKVERALLKIENDRIIERLLNPAEGLYPKLGTITPGGGFAGGPAYRFPRLFGERAVFSTYAMASIAKYWVLDARLTLPSLADGKVVAEIQAQTSDYPSEDFFGLGPNSDRDDDAEYGFRNTQFGARASVTPLPWLIFSGRLDHLDPTIRSDDDDDDSIGFIFGLDNVPGLAFQPDFMRYEAVAEINYREPRGNPRKGGRYALTLQNFNDRGMDRFGFRRTELDLQQYINLYQERRVLALHLLASTSDAHEGQQIPFYYQRTLGGPDDLRGFRRFRFRDENMLLLQAEYRWEIFTAMDGAIFYDAGKVAGRREDLSFKDLESDFGIGFRFGTSNGVFLRIEGAFGSAGGKHFIWRYGHVF